jgi:hypothetical protein
VASQFLNEWHGSCLQDGQRVWRPGAMKKITGFLAIATVVFAQALTAKQFPKSAGEVQVAEALNVLRDLHYRAIGKRITFADMSPEEAQRQYLRALVGILDAGRAMSPAERAALFEEILANAHARGGFHGIQSIFMSGLQAMRASGNEHLFRNGLKLWHELGMPDRSDAGLDVLVIVSPGSHSFAVVSGLPGAELPNLLEHVTGAVNAWQVQINHALPPVTYLRDGSPEDSDFIVDAINSARQSLIDFLKSLVPDPPHTTAEYVIAIASPIWLVPSGIAVGWAVGVLTVAEDLHHYVTTFGGFAIPQHQENPSSSSGQRPILTPSDTENAYPPASSGNPSGTGNWHLVANSGASAPPAAQSPSGSSEPDRHDRGGRTHESSRSKQPDKGKTDKKDSKDAKDAEKKDPSGANDGPKRNDLANDPSMNPPRPGDDGDDSAPRGLRKSRWNGETMSRIVYGDRWFVMHPQGPRVFETKTGADDTDRPDVDFAGTRNPANAHGDLGNDLPHRMGGSAMSEVRIRVVLPVPKDIRPMPVKD